MSDHSDPTARRRQPTPPSLEATEPARRAFLRSAARGLGALTLGTLASGLVRAQHGPGAMPHGHSHAMAAADPQRRAPLPAHDIPWADGTCAFCGMTLATPAGAPQGPTFRERTYAQWVVAAADADAPSMHHFESIACALNHAYVHAVRDGVQGTLYVTDAGGALPASAPSLLLARHAVFHWGERLQVAMMARLVAFADDASRDAHLRTHPDEGRTARYALTTLEDLAPLPEMNLVALLARHSGLLDT